MEFGTPEIRKVEFFSRGAKKGMIFSSLRLCASAAKLCRFLSY